MRFQIVDPTLKLNQIFIEIYGLKDSNKDRDKIHSSNLFPRIYFQTAFLNLSSRKFSSTYESYQAERKYDKVSNSIQENIFLFLPRETCAR